MLTGGYCPTNYQELEIIADPTSPFELSARMKFTGDGPVTSLNGLLELDPANNNCKIALKEAQFLIYPESPFLQLFYSLMTESQTLSGVDVRDVFPLLAPSLVRRTPFFSCGNNCPGGRMNAFKKI